MDPLLLDTAFARRVKSRRGALTEQCEALFEGVSRITLEIGCGHGHWLSAYSAANPEEHCVGVDIIAKRLKRADRKKESLELNKLLFIKAEAREFLEALPESVVLQKIFVLFPDPWPKKRHNRRRLIQDRFLHTLAERAGEGAQFFFRTDNKDYFEHGLEIVQAHARWALCEGEAWPFEHQSFFQDLLPDYQSLIARKIN